MLSKTINNSRDFSVSKLTYFPSKLIHRNILVPDFNIRNIEIGLWLVAFEEQYLIINFSANILFVRIFFDDSNKLDTPHILEMLS